MRFGDGDSEGVEKGRRLKSSACRGFGVGKLRVLDGVTVENRPRKKGVTVSH